MEDQEIPISFIPPVLSSHLQLHFRLIWDHAYLSIWELKLHFSHRPIIEQNYTNLNLNLFSLHYWCSCRWVLCIRFFLQPLFDIRKNCWDSLVLSSWIFEIILNCFKFSLSILWASLCYVLWCHLNLLSARSVAAGWTNFSVSVPT